MNYITLVKQQDDTGCGISCCAMILNQSYESTKREISDYLGWGERKRVFYTKEKEVAGFLKTKGVSLAKRKACSFDELPSLSIISVNPRGNGRYYHWVVSLNTDTNRVILDPEDGGVYPVETWKNQEGGYVLGGKVIEVSVVPEFIKL